MNVERMYSDDELKGMKKYSSDDLESAIESVEGGPTEGRYLDKYRKEFDIKSFKEFNGKRVLEIGSGTRLRFAGNLRSIDVNAEVISFSPIFAHDPYRADTVQNSKPEFVGKTVAGMGENLPFADRTFDRIVCLHVFRYLNSSERRKAFLSEISRVLAPGGIAYIGPVFKEHTLLDSKGQYDNEFSPDSKLTSILVDGAYAIWRTPEWRKPLDETGFSAYRIEIHKDQQ